MNSYTRVECNKVYTLDILFVLNIYLEPIIIYKSADINNCILFLKLNNTRDDNWLILQKQKILSRKLMTKLQLKTKVSQQKMILPQNRFFNA